MESMKLRSLVMALMFLGVFVGQSSAAFTDCYTRCFIFCMIDPSETTVATLSSVNWAVPCLLAPLSAKNINQMVKRWMTVLDLAQRTAPRATDGHRSGIISGDGKSSAECRSCTLVRTFKVGHNSVLNLACSQPLDWTNLDLPLYSSPN
ncbi:hypothetical protein KY289_018293 [Solanum tuberosum]|nr:hypothetical protein KY289_018293 [Solanum tuberosum]